MCSLGTYYETIQRKLNKRFLIRCEIHHLLEMLEELREFSGRTPVEAFVVIYGYLKTGPLFDKVCSLQVNSKN